MLGSVVSDVEILHGLVLVGLYLIAHLEHTSTARATRHFPEINVEHVALIGFDDALEDAVALGQELISNHLYFVIFHIFAEGQYALANQLGVRDDGHRRSHIVCVTGTLGR